MSPAQSQLIADRYRLVEPLGQGGMGRVWMARDELLHRDVAIKELIPPGGLTPDERQEMRERTLREARAIARFNHPNVVRIFDILRTDGDPWIVMEHVASRSLQEVIAQDGPMSTDQAAEIGAGMLAALRAAHRAGVVHRDVKPGNVLLGHDGRVVLTDFGLATVPGDPVVTRTGLVLGSPAYIAPERAHDGTAGPAADLWSLGATLYAAVEGQPPYARPSAIATLAALATEPPAPARRAGPLKPLLNGLLRKDPAQRIDAEEAERLLRRAIGRRARPSLSLLPGARRGQPERNRTTGQLANGVTSAPTPRAGGAPVIPGRAESPVADQVSAAGATAALPGGAVESVDATTVLDAGGRPNAGPATAPQAPKQGSDGSRTGKGGRTPPPASSTSPRRTVPDRAVAAPAALAAGTAVTPARVGRRARVVASLRGSFDILRQRPAWLAGGAATAVAVAATVAMAMPGDRPAGPVAAANGGLPSTAPSGTPADTGAPGGVPPTAPPSAAPTPVVTPSSGPTAAKLPNGWRLYQGDGYTVGVPAGWRVQRDGQMLFFRENSGQYRLLGIGNMRSAVSDPVAELREQERQRRGRYGQYNRIAIRPVDYRVGPAADWEFNYTKAARLHVVHRGIVTGPRSWHSIFWLTPERTWKANVPYFNAVVNSFQVR
ncbi:serine/threonine-protein kinase [Pilimelia columellifera]